MKIAVIGASGACGRQLVTRALTLGHTVTSVVRASSELPETPGVRVFRGDLTDASFLAEALDGSDAILSALGFRIGGIAPWHKPPDPAFLEDSAKAIVAAAGKAGVGRLMAISSGGVGDSWDIVPAAFRFFVRCSALRHVLPRLGEMETVYLSSGLDVCMVRPSGLTDAEATGKAVVTGGFSGQAQISRADVAAWMLAALEQVPFAESKALITVTGATPV